MLFIFNFLFSPLPTPALICLLTFGTAIFLWLINRPQPVLPLIDLDNQSVGIEGGARRGAFQSTWAPVFCIKDISHHRTNLLASLLKIGQSGSSLS
uniref:Acyl-CoA synthetase long-chain family member 5 n=1 Tax=Mus musculus TaxID=10090 RepID=A0A286YE29_MOUSE